MQGWQTLQEQLELLLNMMFISSEHMEIKTSHGKTSVLSTYYIVHKPVINKCLLKRNQLINVHWITKFKYSIIWDLCPWPPPPTFPPLSGLPCNSSCYNIFHCVAHLSFVVVDWVIWLVQLLKKKMKKKSVSYKMHLLSSFVCVLESGLARGPHPKPPTKSKSYFYMFVHVQLYLFRNDAPNQAMFT